jgi:hypothetical protein
MYLAMELYGLGERDVLRAYVLRGEREVQGDAMQGETVVLGMVMRLHDWTSFRLSAPGRSPNYAGGRPSSCTFHPARSECGMFSAFTSTALLLLCRAASHTEMQSS